MLGTGCSGVVLTPRTLVLLHPGRLNKPGHKGMVLVVGGFAGWGSGWGRGGWFVSGVGGSQCRRSVVVVAFNYLGMGDSGDSGELALLA